MDQNQVAISLLNVLSVGGFHEILDVLYEALGLPIVLSGAEYHVIKQVPEHEIGDYVFDLLLKDQRPNQKSMEIFRDSNIIKRANQRGVPFYTDEGYFKDIPRVITNVSVHNEVVGYMVIALTEDVSIEWVKDIAKLGAQALALHFEKSGMIAKRTKSQRVLYLEKLLSGTLLQSELKDVEGSLSFDAPYFLFVIHPKDASNDVFYIQTTIRSVYPSLIPIILDQSIYYVVDKAMMLTPPLITQDRLVTFLTSLDAYVGVSESFDDLMDFSAFKKQADLALALSKQKDIPTVYYREHVFELMIQSIEKEFGSSFIHPALGVLKAYDTENDTYLYETLKVYSLSYMNAKVASDRLHIHRNTLTYRLSRIEDVSLLNLDDSHEMLLVYLSYYINQDDL